MNYSAPPQQSYQTFSFSTPQGEFVDKWAYDTVNAKLQSTQQQLCNEKKLNAQWLAYESNKAAQTELRKYANELLKYDMVALYVAFDGTPHILKSNGSKYTVDRQLSVDRSFKAEKIKNLEDGTEIVRISFTNPAGNPRGFSLDARQFDESHVYKEYQKSGGQMLIKGPEGKQKFFAFLSHLFSEAEPTYNFTGWRQFDGKWYYRPQSQELLTYTLLPGEDLTDSGKILRILLLIYSILHERLPDVMHIDRLFVFLYPHGLPECSMSLSEKPTEFRNRLQVREGLPITLIRAAETTADYKIKQNLGALLENIGTTHQKNVYVLAAKELSPVTQGCLPVTICDESADGRISGGYRDQSGKELLMQDLIDLIRKNPDAFDHQAEIGYNTMKSQIDPDHPARNPLQTLNAIARILNWVVEMHGGNPEEVYQKIQRHLYHFLKYWDSNESAQIPERFVNGLREAIETRKLRLEQKASPPSDYSSENTLLVDSDFYYISSSAVETLIRKYLSEFLPAQVIKELENAGYLTSPLKVYLTTTPYSNLEPRLRKIPRRLLEKDDTDITDASARPSFRLGTDGSGTPVYLSDQANNQHILITGQSGSGKSTAMVRLAENYAKADAAVIMLDYSDTWAHLPADIRSSLSQRWHVLDVWRDGLPISLWPEAEDDKRKLNENAEILADVLGLKARDDIDQLKETFRLAYEKRGDALIDDFFEEMRDVLTNADADDNERSRTERLRTLLDLFQFERNVWPKDLIQPGRVLVLDFSGFDEDSQRKLAELVMSWLFAQRQKGAARHEPLVLILDEVQKLGTGAKDILPKLLREGRKFDISLIMATQLLNNYDGAKRSLFEQAATTLAFQQDGAAAALITKDKALAKNQKDRLCSLSRGTCLAIGRLLLGNMVSNQPILLNYVQKPPIRQPEQKAAANQAPFNPYKIKKKASPPN